MYRKNSQRWLVTGEGDVGGLQALGALLDAELNALAFFQVLIAIDLDGGIVDEDIVAALASDKAVAFAAVEPFDCAGNSFRHFFCFLVTKNLDIEDPGLFVRDIDKKNSWDEP